MTRSLTVRKVALTTHVTSSVGWLCGVAAFLALAIAGIGSHDAQIVRAAYLAMHLLTWFVIVPLCLAALLTGIVQSLGTTWGLFRHYWSSRNFFSPAVRQLLAIAGRARFSINLRYAADQRSDPQASAVFSYRFRPQAA